MSKEYVRLIIKGKHLSFSVAIPMLSATKIMEYVAKTEHKRRIPMVKKPKLSDQMQKELKEGMK